MYCKNCGNKLNENEKFCPNCGHSVNNIENKIVESKNIEPKKKYSKNIINLILSTVCIWYAILVAFIIYVMPYTVEFLSYAFLVILTFGLIITSEGFSGFQEFISDKTPSKISSSYIVEIVVLLILALIFFLIYFSRRKNIKKGYIQDKLVPPKKIIFNSILFSLIIIFSFSFVFELIRSKETDEKTIKLNDIQMTYDKNIWEKDKETENPKVIIHDNSSITLSVSKSYQYSR